MKSFLATVFIFSILSTQAQPSYTFTDLGGTPQGPSIDCGAQEVLLNTQFEFLVNNTTSGFVPLNISNIALEQNGLTDYTNHWSLEVTDDIGTVLDFSLPVASNFPLHLNLTFEPRIDAPTSLPMVIDLRISSNASGNAENILTVLGQATKTVINYSIVLDRSGSMMIMEDDGLGGTKRRIDLVSEAADYFLGLEYLRVEDVATGFPGDKIGIVKYNSTVDGTYLSLSTATNTLLSDAQTNLVSTVATNDAAFIQPTGGTATGDAMIESINNQLTTPATGDVKNVIILLSDGYENVGSLITDVGAGSVGSEIIARPDINIYSIGMGAANMVSLEQYSNLSGLSTPQTFYYDPTQDPMALNSFFFKIYQNAIGLASVIDPTFYVNLSGSEWVDIAQATISSSDQQITVSITYPEDISDVTEFRLMQPSGTVLSEGSVNGLNTVKVEGRNHIIYQVTYSGAASDSSYVGEWTLQGKGTLSSDTVVVERKQPSVNLTNVPVGFAVATLSGLTIDVNAGTGNVEPGDEILVTVDAEDETFGGEVEIEDIDVTITDPSGNQVDCPPSQDRCGPVTTSYPYTHKEGIYEVYVKTILRNEKGERTVRDAYQQVVVSNQKREILSAPETPCPSCDLIKILIIISILMFILLFIILVRKRKG